MHAYCIIQHHHQKSPFWFGKNWNIKWKVGKRCKHVTHFVFVRGYYRDRNASCMPVSCKKKKRFKTNLSTEMTVIRGFIPYTCLNYMYYCKILLFCSQTPTNYLLNLLVCCLTVFLNFLDIVFPTTYLELPTTLRQAITGDTVFISNNVLTI